MKLQGDLGCKSFLVPDQNRKRKPLSLMSSLTLQGLPRLVKKFNVDFRSSLRVIDPPVDGALRYITTYMVLREQGSVMKVRVMLNLFGRGRTLFFDHELC